MLKQREDLNLIKVFQKSRIRLINILVSIIFLCVTTFVFECVDYDVFVTFWLYLLFFLLIEKLFFILD